MSVHRALDDRAPADRRPGRRERVRLGIPRPAAAGAGRSRSGCATSGVSLVQVIETAGQRAVGLAADLRRGVDPGHRRLHRHAEPAARRPAPLADQLRGRPREGARSRTRGGRNLVLGDVASVVEDHQPLIGDARRQRRRRRPAARRREAPGGEHARRDRSGVEDALETLAARPLRGRVRHDGLPAGVLHRRGDRQPHARAGDRRAARSPWRSPPSSSAGAAALIALLVDPAVAGRRRRSSCGRSGRR